jgi:hypothetical protein
VPKRLLNGFVLCAATCWSCSAEVTQEVRSSSLEQIACLRWECKICHVSWATDRHGHMDPGPIKLVPEPDTLLDERLP